MINYLTKVERNKINEITERLTTMYSPVLRLQAILQFSQIVDMLMLGDIGLEHDALLLKEVKELDERLEGLQERLSDYEGETQQPMPQTPPEVAHTPQQPCGLAVCASGGGLDCDDVGNPHT